MKDYENVRSNLLDMLQDLDERLGKITDDVKHTSQPLAKNLTEQSQEVENDQVLDALGNLTRGEIDQVKNSLSRIDNGDYGQCVICGGPISEQRLLAMPLANKCIQCANQESDDG